MRRILLNITVSSLAALVIYLLVIFISIPVMSLIGEENQYLKNSIYAIVVSTAYPFVLLYLSKKRTFTCDEELLSDYPAGEYISAKNDLPIVLKREWRYFICIGIINTVSELFTQIDIMVSGKPTVSGIFVLFSPLRILSVVFPFSAIAGTIIASLYVCALYLIALLHYRKKRALVIKSNRN